MTRSRRKFGLKLSVFIAVILSLLFVFSTSANAVRVVVSTRIVSCTVNDRSLDFGYFHLDVKITNAFVGCIYDISPASWTLEWEALTEKRQIYARGEREGRFGTTVASASEEICLPALKYGYFRYRMTVSNAGETVVGDWDECCVNSTHTGGGGRHRSIKVNN